MARRNETGTKYLRKPSYIAVGTVGLIFVCIELSIFIAGDIPILLAQRHFMVRNIRMLCGK
jgi:hypothetical protein